MKISTKMISALKDAGLAREWNMGSMQRVYLDLSKLNRKYTQHIMDMPADTCFPANSKEVRTGKVWIDVNPESEEYLTMDYSNIDVEANYLYECMTALFAAIFPDVPVEEVEEVEDTANAESEVVITFTRESISAHLADCQSMEHDTQDTCTYYLHMTDDQKMLPSLHGQDVCFTADRDFTPYMDDEDFTRFYDDEVLTNPGFADVVDSLYEKAVAYFTELAAWEE